LPSSEYNVNITISTKDKTSGPAKQAAKGLEGVAKAAKALATAMVVKQITKYVTELVKLGAAAERQETALDNLARAAGTSGSEIVSAIRVASDFTIDRMGAMQTANRAMIMGVAESPAQFERLTKVAVALGRAMGVDAVTSIDNFVTAAGRQSYMIADNLGLIVRAEEAQKTYAAQLGKTAEELTLQEKRQAFLNEMLVQGEAKMGALGDSVVDNAAKVEQATAAWQTFKSLIGEGLSTALLGSVEGMGRLNQFIDQHGEKIKTVMAFVIAFTLKTGNQAEALGNLIDAFSGATQGTEAHRSALDRTSPEIDRYRNALQEASEIMRYAATTDMPVLRAEAARVAERSADMADALDHVSYVSEGYIRQLHLGVEANDAIEKTILDTIEALEGEEEAARDAASAHASLAETLMDASAAEIASAAIRQLTGLLDEGKISAEDYTAAVEETQLEFGLASQASINLSNRLVELVKRTGEGEVSAADFKEELELLIAVNEKENAELEQFGEILAEDTIKLDDAGSATDDFTSSSDQATIAVGQAADATADLSTKMVSLGANMEAVRSKTSEVVQGLKALAAEIASLPGEKKIKIITEHIHLYSPGATIPEIERQHGGPVKAGMPYIVGEHGPELFVPGTSGQIINNRRTEQIIGSNNTYNFTDPRAMAYLGMQERARARDAFAYAAGM